MISTYSCLRSKLNVRGFGSFSFKRLSISTRTESHSTVLIYQRSPDRTFLPRSALAVSSFQTIYWIWYVFDFTPSVNHAASVAAATVTSDTLEQVINHTMVDPKIGYLGLILGAIVSTGAFFYPKYLINQIRWDPNTSKLYIKTYQSPLVTTPSDASAYEFPKGSVYLDNVDVSTILDKHGGDMAQYRGHLGVKAIHWRGSFLLQLVENAKDEVKDADLLLQLLLKDTKSVLASAGHAKEIKPLTSGVKKIQSIRIRKHHKKR